MFHSASSILLCHFKSGWKLQIVPPGCGLLSQSHVPSGYCSPQHAQSLSSTQNSDCVLGPEGELPELSKSCGWWDRAGGGGVPTQLESVRCLTPHSLRSPHHSLSLTDVCLFLPPPSFSALSLARYPPCASRSSPATIRPAITPNSCLAFWDFACFSSLLYPTSLVGYFHSGFFFVMRHFHSELSNYFTFRNRTNQICFSSTIFKVN